MLYIGFFSLNDLKIFITQASFFNVHLNSNLINMKIDASELNDILKNFEVSISNKLSKNCKNVQSRSDKEDCKNNKYFAKILKGDLYNTHL